MAGERLEKALKIIVNGLKKQPEREEFDTG